MVNVLLSSGALIDARTRDLLTPLHCAARSGHDSVVDLLLEKAAPISAKTKVLHLPPLSPSHSLLPSEWSCSSSYGSTR